MPGTDAYLPSGLREMIDDFTAKLLGHAPDVEPVRDRVWRATWDNGRVRIWLQLQYMGPGRCRTSSARLWVDGVERERYEDDEALFRLWRGASYEDAKQEPEQPGEFAPSEIGEELPIDAAPAAIRWVLRDWDARFGGQVRVRYARDGRMHVLALDVPDRQSAVRYWVEHNTGRVWNRGIEVWAHGRDVSRLAAGSISEALALLGAEAQEDGAAPPPGVRRESGAKVNTAVQTRRATVIRT